MSLRPRYSLLTLLIVTALVAGGVKLWYGPHHVVEQVSPVEEVEYTFTRDWQGNKAIVGPKIKRVLDPESLPFHIKLYYYRAGVDTNWVRIILFDDKSKAFTNAFAVLSNKNFDLSPEEREEYDRAAEQEYQRLRVQGYAQDKRVTGDIPPRWYDKLDSRY